MIIFSGFSGGRSKPIKLRSEKGHDAARKDSVPFAFFEDEAVVFRHGQSIGTLLHQAGRHHGQLNSRTAIGRHGQVAKGERAACLVSRRLVNHARKPVGESTLGGISLADTWANATLPPNTA